MTSHQPYQPPGPYVTEPYGPPPPPRRRVWPWVTGALVLVAAITATIAVAVWPTATRTATKACEAAVSAELKAPSTAKFGGVTTSPIGGGLSVAGWVDSENGFGAPVRTPWDCTALVNPNRQWRAQDVRVG
jgi:hypothetical protein